MPLDPLELHEGLTRADEFSVTTHPTQTIFPQSGSGSDWLTGSSMTMETIDGEDEGLYRIRAAIPHDAGAIREVARKTYAATYRDIYNQDYIERMLDRAYQLSALQKAINNPEGHFLVAGADRLVGFAEVSQARQGWELVRIYILPLAQGRGIGRQLLSRVEGFLIESGVESYFARVDVRNTSAHAFYERVGFHCQPEKRVGNESYWVRELGK